MTERGFAIAIVGAAGELGRDLRAVLEERAFAVSTCELYDDAEAILDLDDDDDGIPVRSIEGADLSGAEIVFFCGPPEQSVRYYESATAGGGVAIDLSQGVAALDDVALVVPEVNAHAVDTAIDEGVIASPAPAAIALAVALAPLEEALHLRRVSVTCLEPVSSAPGGVRELARQTGELLSGRDAAPELWPARIAFNLIPQVGDIGPTGATESEWRIQRQLRGVLDLPDLPISAHVVRVPTFYGLGMVVGVETDEPVDAELAHQLLREAPGVFLHEGERDVATFPTLGDAIGSEATHIGRLREDPTVPFGLSFWLVVDGLRKGATVNAVQIAECVVRSLRARS